MYHSEMADRLARTVGVCGAMAECLHYTEEHPTPIGFRDSTPARMDAKVAERLAGL
jgi:cation transport regulator ChaC